MLTHIDVHSESGSKIGSKRVSLPYEPQVGDIITVKDEGGMYFQVTVFGRAYSEDGDLHALTKLKGRTVTISVDEFRRRNKDQKVWFLDQWKE